MEIIVNRCYGGWNLSHAAYMRIAELKGMTLYPYMMKSTMRNDKYEHVHVRTESSESDFFVQYSNRDLGETTAKFADTDLVWYRGTNEERTDPDIIKVVRELGEAASGRCSRLEIVEIPDGVNWEVDEYDGMETIHEVHRSW